MDPIKLLLNTGFLEGDTELVFSSVSFDSIFTEIYLKDDILDF